MTSISNNSDLVEKTVSTATNTEATDKSIRHSPSMETVGSNVTRAESVSTNYTTRVPIVPYNSPEPSIAGDGTTTAAADIRTILADRLHQTVNSSAAGPVSELVGAPCTMCTECATPDAETTFEHTTWAEYAEEDMVRALARLAMLAKDESKKTLGGKSVESIYSTVLAKCIKGAEIKFDFNALV